MVLATELLLLQRLPFFSLSALTSMQRKKQPQLFSVLHPKDPLPPPLRDQFLICSVDKPTREVSIELDYLPMHRNIHETLAKNWQSFLSIFHSNCIHAEMVTSTLAPKKSRPYSKERYRAIVRQHQMDFDSDSNTTHTPQIQQLTEQNPSTTFLTLKRLPSPAHCPGHPALQNSALPSRFPSLH